MALKATLVGEAQHLVVHAGRVSDTEHVDASTAMLLCAHTRTWLSRIRVSLMASTRVVVFPVPGGP